VPDLDFLIAEFQERSLVDSTLRTLCVPQVARKAAVVIGMRRTGKTFLMYQQIQRLLASGVDKRDILYANFEDDRLPIGEPGLLGRLLEAFYRSNPAARERGAHLFLDEIQMVPGWPRFVRRVLDTESVQVVLSGSSAKLLSTEVATELRGRGLPVELFPFSFAESAVAAGLVIPATWPPGPRQRSRLEAHLDTYIACGGFPEVQGMALTERIQTLQDYVELVLLRDVIERHRIENAVAARTFARVLLQSPARSFTVNKAHADLHSRGLKVSKETLHALLDHFQDAYLVFSIPVFKKSERAQATNPRKLYAIDPGLAGAMSQVTATDVGARLENAIFLELRRRHGRLLQGQVSYYLTASGREVDFVVGDVFEQRAGRLVQACAHLSEPQTREREVRALVEAMDETGLDHAEIVTLREEETVKTDAGTIRVVPAWRWMLEDR
jgi:predicted AAA+ superfamily ATPase